MTEFKEFIVNIYAEGDYSYNSFTCDGSCHCECDGSGCECNWG